MYGKAIDSICTRFGDALSNASLAQRSFWGIGGPADCFWDATSESSLVEFLSLARNLGVPVCVIGRTTNILFDDAGYRGCVVRLGRNIAQYRFDGDTLEAACGCWTPGLAFAAARLGLGGMEHCIGIPASFGGLVYMNGGSMRKTISELVHSVRAVSANGVVRDIPASDCAFDYRHSRFQQSGEIILSARLVFREHVSYAKQRVQMLKILRERSSKFPRKLPSCGSTFKSSPELFAAYGPPGKVIEDANFKGYRIGGAQVSSLHANFIVNCGGASSKDVLALVAQIRAKVRASTGLELVPEFKYLHPERGLCEGGWQ